MNRIFTKNILPQYYKTVYTQWDISVQIKSSLILSLNKINGTSNVMQYNMQSANTNVEEKEFFYHVFKCVIFIRDMP